MSKGPIGNNRRSSAIICRVRLVWRNRAKMICIGKKSQPNAPKTTMSAMREISNIPGAMAGIMLAAQISTGTIIGANRLMGFLRSNDHPQGRGASPRPPGGTCSTIFFIQDRYTFFLQFLWLSYRVLQHHIDRLN